MKIEHSIASATVTHLAPKANLAQQVRSGIVDRPKNEVQSSGQVHQLPDTSTGGDFDAARVAAIRGEILAGRYKPSPERIADGVLDSVRHLLK